MTEPQDDPFIHDDMAKLLEKEYGAEVISRKDDKWETVYFFDNGENVTLPTTMSGNSLLSDYLDVLIEKIEDEELDTPKVHMTEIIHEHDMETYTVQTEESEEIEEKGITFTTMGPHLEIIGDMKTIVVDMDDAYYDEWLEVAEEELEEL